MNEQIRNYINENLTKGLRIEDIKRNLELAGRSKEDVEKIFVQYNIELQKTVQSLQKNDRSEEAKDDQSSENIDEEDVPGNIIKKIVAGIVAVLLIVVVAVVVINRNPSEKEESGIDSSVPEEIQEEFLPIWRQMFIEQNKIDEEYYDKYIFPTKISLNKENKSGDEFLVEFEQKIDWVVLQNQASIIIRLRGQQDYLLLDEIRNGVTGGVVKSSDPENPHFWQEEPFLEVEYVISEDEVKNLLDGCRSGMKAASKTFKISNFSREGDLKERLLYRGVRTINTNQVVMAEIDLETEEIYCYEADLKFN